MPKNREQSENRDDSRKMQASREGKSKHLDVCASSQRLREEQEARPLDSKGKSIDSHPSTSVKEAARSLHDQPSDTQQDLGASTRDLARRVGGASTRDLARRVVDANNRYRRSLSNPNRDIGSKNQAASSSADWSMKAEEAIIARDASSEQIKQLIQKRSDLLRDLQRKQNKLDSTKNNIEIKKIEGKIKLEEIKQRNAIIRAKSFKNVYEAAKSLESNQ